MPPLPPVLKEWQDRKAFMTSDRGVWGDTGDVTQPITHWKRDTHENYARMRIKTCPNKEFNSHTDAKFYDDYDLLRFVCF